MRLRGALSLLAAAILFPVGDFVQRIIVPGLVRLRPPARDGILEGWIRLCARASLRGIAQAVGGARIAPLPAIEGRAGTLILMNHQSLLDIPLAVLAVRGRYPLIVTRKRYARGIPLVSPMLRFYKFPLVEPGTRTRDQLQALAEVARTADRPLLVFPEGHRSRDGEIRPFKKGGVETILTQRSWQTYVLVADGFWRCGRLQDYVAHIASVRGRSVCLGPFPFDARTQSPTEFADRMRAQMIEGLARLRTDGAASS